MTKRNPIGKDQLLPEIDYAKYVFSKKEVALHILSCAFIAILLSRAGTDTISTEKKKAGNRVSRSNFKCFFKFTGGVQRGKCISRIVQGYCIIIWKGFRDGCRVTIALSEAKQ